VIYWLIYFKSPLLFAKVDSILKVISFSTLQGSTSIETQGSTQLPGLLKITAPSTVSSAAPSNYIDTIVLYSTVQ